MGITSNLDGTTSSVFSISTGNNKVDIRSNAGRLEIRHNGGDWFEPQVLTHIASVAPTVNDDVTSPFFVGQFWMDDAANNLYICEDNTDGAAVWTVLTGGGGGTPTKVEISGQTIDGGVVANDPVFFDDTSSSWKSSDSISTTPQGIFTGTSGIVALFGKITGLSNLTADTNYWLADGGGLETVSGDSSTKTFIGYAVSTSILFLNIHVQGDKVSVLSDVTVTRGFVGGGLNGGTRNIIDLIDTTTSTGTPTDRGDLTVARHSLGGNVSGAVLGWFAGGNTGSIRNIIDSIDITTDNGDATDTGDLSTARQFPAGVLGNSIGFWCGGLTTTSASSSTNIIDEINLSSATQNASSGGTLSSARYGMAPCHNSANGFLQGGLINSVEQNFIDFFDNTTSSNNGADGGNLTTTRGQGGGLTTSTNGFAGGGASSNVIDSLDMSTTSNSAIDRGNLTVARNFLAGVSGSVLGYFCGGSGASNVVDQIDITTTSVINASDYGDLTVARLAVAGLI